jgi:hypothetical protein
MYDEAMEAIITLQAARSFTPSGKSHLRRFTAAPTAAPASGHFAFTRASDNAMISGGNPGGR